MLPFFKKVKIGLALCMMLFAVPAMAGPVGLVEFRTENPALLKQDLDALFEDRYGAPAFFVRPDGTDGLHLERLAWYVYQSFPEDQESYPDFSGYLDAFKAHNLIPEGQDLLTLAQLGQGLWRPGYQKPSPLEAAAQRIAELEAVVADLVAENGELRAAGADATAKASGIASALIADIGSGLLIQPGDHIPYCR